MLSYKELAVSVQHITTRSGASVSTILPYKSAQAHDLMCALKFDNNLYARTLCIRILRDALTEYISERTLFGETVILCTIPASRIRTQERGFDHMTELAENILLPDMSFVPLLQRAKETVPQRTLHAHARLKNMQNALTCDVSMLPQSHNLHIIVLDDVVTTGSTLLEAQRALAYAGMLNVSLWAIAHA